MRTASWSGRRGFAPVCNHGARLARGELLLFLNDDVLVCEQATLEMLERALAAPGVGIAGPDVVSVKLGRSESGTVVYWHHGVLEARQHRVAGSGLVPVAYVCGAALAVRAATFRALGGFDERLAPYYWEDVSLGLKASRLGLRSVVVADVHVVHEHGATISEEDEAARRVAYERNRVLVTIENLRGTRWPSFVAWLPLRFAKSVLGDGTVARGLRAALPTVCDERGSDANSR